MRGTEMRLCARPARRADPKGYAGERPSSSGRGGAISASASTRRLRNTSVSPDSPELHVKFKEKYGLPFTLLADEDHAVAETYGVWVEKSMYGKKYMGIERSTFVIDADGKIVKIMRNVKPAEHADDVLAALA